MLVFRKALFLQVRDEEKIDSLQLEVCLQL